MTDRYTLINGALQLSDSGEFVRSQDFDRALAQKASAETTAADLQGELATERATASAALIAQIAAHQATRVELADASARIAAMQNALDVVRAEVDLVLPPAPAVPQAQLELIARSFVEQLGKAIKPA
jgi:hypothetical protein